MGIIYSAEQLAAIEGITLPLGADGAVRIGVLTGGPGSGKTAISQEVMLRWRDLYGAGAIHALSPTGKAASRFFEATQFACETIHKSVGRWEDSGPGDDELVSMRAVLIDESSMVDQYLLDRLFKALPETVERLLFVGDADQLPSVGPGCVLRDLIACGRVPVWRLTKIYRQSEKSWIAVNAQRINRGERPVVESDSEDYFEVICETHEEVRSAVGKILREVPGAQVLVPQKRYEIGAVALNEMAREIVNPAAGRAGWKAGATVFHKGDRVIHRRNNYSIQVMNGEVGTVADLVKLRDGNGKDHECLVVDYGDRRVTYTKDTAVDELKLAFALTIHSSQGSEFGDVIVVLHSSHSYLLNRALAYTAISRAKTRCWLVGDEKGVKLAVKRNNPRERITMLAERVRSIR